MRYFERVLPGQADVDSALLAEAIEKLSQPRYGAHALMVLRHGKVVAEHYRAPYEAGTPHTMFSVSKSFTAIAAGFAQQEGLIRFHKNSFYLLDDLLFSAEPEIHADV